MALIKIINVPVSDKKKSSKRLKVRGAAANGNSAPTKKAEPKQKKVKEVDKSLESWIWDAACSIRGAKDAPVMDPEPGVEIYDPSCGSACSKPQNLAYLPKLAYDTCI